MAHVKVCLRGCILTKKLRPQKSCQKLFAVYTSGVLVVIMMLRMSQEHNKDTHEDIHLEETEEMAEAVAQSKKANKKADALKQCQQEKQEYLDGWQRARADFANAKASHDKALAGAQDRAWNTMLRDVVNALDSFDMAMANKEAWESVDENWRQGVEYIYQQFTNMLEQYDVASFGEKGDVFDPEIHTSAGQEPAENEEQADTICAVLRKGYRRKETLLRPAQVTVHAHAKDA